jgi:hypothetical protein
MPNFGAIINVLLNTIQITGDGVAYLEWGLRVAIYLPYIRNTST